MRSGASASKLAPLMQSESSVGIARRARDANLKGSSRSSFTTKHRAEARLVGAMVGSRRSVLVESLFIGRPRYFAMRNAIRNFVVTAVGLPPCRGGLYRTRDIALVAAASKTCDGLESSTLIFVTLPSGVTA